MSLGFGYRARIGQLYPSGGICDFEMQRMAPEGVQFLTTRMSFRDTSKQSDIDLVANLERDAQLLADAKVDLIAFNCTAASLIAGPKNVCSRIEKATGIRATTTIEAVEAALRTLSARKIALFTAYREDVVEAEKAYLANEGFEVVAEGHIECLEPIAQGSLLPEAWLDLAKATDTRQCDALLFSCAGIYISPVIAEIETVTGKPVVTSNSALLWHVLNELGLPQDGVRYGKLFGIGRSKP
ncbi:hypothetical protein ACFFP0_03920 [Rhizobium puerariae]|uniref:Arylmalonate decarboxylase n=1 Tax=Rhizobium puerariae TaxID=1585791 RepID=A0ABV6AF67_9HYPH